MKSPEAPQSHHEIVRPLIELGSMAVAWAVGKIVPPEALQVPPQEQ